MTVSEVFRLALDQFCERELTAPQRSRYDDIIGVAEGPADLATRASEHFADASLVATAERLRLERIVTLDRTGFTIYRLNDRKPFLIVGP